MYIYSIYIYLCGRGMSQDHVCTCRPIPVVAAVIGSHYLVGIYSGVKTKFVSFEIFEGLHPNTDDTLLLLPA